MNLRHCHVCGPTVQHSALLMHRLDGYMSTFDRVVWLCGRHWAEAQKSPVSDLLPDESARKSGARVREDVIVDGSKSSVAPRELEFTMVLVQPSAIDRVLEAVA